MSNSTTNPMLPLLGYSYDYSMMMPSMLKKKTTFRSKNWESPLSKKEDMFLLVHVKGNNLSQIQEKNQKYQMITENILKTLDLEENGNASLNVLDPQYKNNFFFPGIQKSIEIKFNHSKHHLVPFEFIAVLYFYKIFNFRPILTL